ncbi:MAG: TIGR01212 family radical SAM protein, partial [Lachnospiraceae bacterium]|nr:TIGR01212 family radical SAM protein [Lachnospiraceae bacterium]
MHYLSFNDAMRARFGTKVYRLSLQTGCTCPNRDGTIGTGGCTFCSEGGSGDFAAPFMPIEEQIKEARKRVDTKIPASIAPEDRRYIAYFQSYTNTYGDVDRLRTLYTEAISHPQIVALDIGTRPDCLPPEMVEMLQNLQLSSGKPVWVELGLQTIHEETARRIRRGYELPVFEDAYRRLKASGLEIIVHVILGLPKESRQDMLETVRYLSSLTPTLDGIKLQLLHILKGTELAREYEADPFPLFSLDSYCDLVVDCLRLLPPETVVHRLTGDGPKRLLVAPLWC